MTGYLGQDNRGKWKPNPRHYPLGSPQNPTPALPAQSRKGDRARAAHHRVRERELHEPVFGELGEVTSLDEARVRKMDEDCTDEFYGDGQ